MTELDKLQGTWQIKAFETDGQTMSAPAFEDAKVVVDGDRFTSIGMGATYEGRIELGPGKKPKTFDLLFTVGHAKGTRNLGIYKLDDDRWTICLATHGSRPRTFATKPGSGHALEILERGGVALPAAKVKKRAASRTRSDSTAAATVLEGEWEMVAGVFNGVVMAENLVKWCKRITRGDVTSVVAGPQVMLKASFTIDQSQQPHAVDYLNLDGSHKGKSQAGIFSLNGENLMICMAAPGNPRPADFSSQPRDGRSYTTWRLLNK